jgi:hypothetical protein
MNGDHDVESLDYAALEPLLAGQRHLRCLVLNACNSLTGIQEPLGVPVVGMIDTIDDDAAVAFAKGFYDAIAAGQPPEGAFKQGVISMKSKGMDEHVVVWLSPRSQDDDVATASP